MSQNSMFWSKFKETRRGGFWKAAKSDPIKFSKNMVFEWLIGKYYEFMNKLGYFLATHTKRKKLNEYSSLHYFHFSLYLS